MTTPLLTTSPLTVPQLTAPLLTPPASRPPARRVVPAPEPDSLHHPTLPFDAGPHTAIPRADGLTPAAERTVRLISVAVAEVLTGRRPQAQLLAVLAPELADQVDHLRAAGDVRGFAVASLRVQVPREDVAEVCLRLADARSSRAVALRLELSSGRWSCTALEAALCAALSRPSRGSA